jgi:hypothetical protein
MTEKELQLVSLEQAKRLKKLGFDWSVNHAYKRSVNNSDDFVKETLNYYPLKTSNEKEWVSGEIKDSIIAAPTVALVLKWFRDTQKVKGLVTHNTATRIFRIHWYKIDSYDMNKRGGWGKYEDAESALLDKLLTITEREKEDGQN